MLLIDNEDGEIAERQEQSRARPGDDLHLALREASPDAGTLARADAGMPFRRPHAEALRETIEELRRQRDFRHQDQRLPSLAQSFRDGLEINLRLARAGDAFEQSDGKAAQFDLGDERGGGLGLIGLELRRGEIRIAGRRDRLGRQRHRLQRALIDERIDDAGRARSACSARSLFVTARSPSIAARTRARAGVMRLGSGPARRKPMRGLSSTAAKGARAHMRRTMPRGLKVQRATQSTKLRRFSLSGGMSNRAAIALRLLPPAPAAISQTAPTVCRVPSGTSTKSPTARSSSSGTR